MQFLLEKLVETIRNAPTLHYLQWVGVLDSELAQPPAEPHFPYVGLIDGGISSTSLPNRRNAEVLSVKVVAYQSLLAPDPGAHLLGNPSLPGGYGTGLLQISEDLKNLLQDNFLGQSNIHWAYRDLVSPSELLVDEAASRFVMLQKSLYTYRRIT